MADFSYTPTYLREDFAALVGNIPIELLRAQLAALPLTLPIVDAWLSPSGHAVTVKWAEPPPAEDIAAVNAFIAAFAGGETTSAPIELNSFAASTSTSTTHADKIAQTTPPLDAGTYQVIWTSSIRMQAVAANTGVEGKIRLERSDGAAVEQTDAWDLNVNHAFNGSITFVVQAGQTISVALSFARLGASGTAEMSGARVTIDQISPGQ